MTLRPRLVIAAACAALVLALGPGVASACINVGISGTPSGGAGPESPAGPGDRIHFTIGGLETGARWWASIDGRPVGSGTADGGPVSGEFTMPDFGPTSRDVTLSATVEHSDIPGDTIIRTSTLHYRPPAPPPPPADQPAPQPQPAPQTPVSATPPATPPPPSPPSAGGGPSGPHPHGSPGSGGPGRGAAAPVPVPVTESTAPTLHVRVHHVSRRHAARAIEIRADRAVPVVTPLPRRDDAFPWLVVALAAAAAATAGATGGALVLLRRRRKPPPDARGLEVEAELQEIIAEERAKQTTPTQRR